MRTDVPIGIRSDSDGHFDPTGAIGKGEEIIGLPAYLPGLWIADGTAVARIGDHGASCRSWRRWWGCRCRNWCRCSASCSAPTTGDQQDCKNQAARRKYRPTCEVL